MFALVPPISTAKDALGHLEPKTSVEEMRAKFAKWNERTVTSPSGRTLCHCKILYDTLRHFINFFENRMYDTKVYDTKISTDLLVQLA